MPSILLYLNTHGSQCAHRLPFYKGGKHNDIISYAQSQIITDSLCYQLVTKRNGVEPLFTIKVSLPLAERF